MTLDIDLLELLTSYGIDNIKLKGHYIQLSCPFHDDNNPSAAFYLDNQRFVCFGCRTSVNIYEFIALLEDIPVSEVKSRYRVELSKDIIINKLRTKINDFYNKESERSVTKVYDESILNNFTSEYDYMFNRGFNIETLKKFEVGYYAAKSMVSLPFRDRHGNLIGVYGRKTYPTSRAKYKPIVPIDSGYPKYDHLYGLHLVRGDTLMLVEGNLVVLKTHQEGFPFSAAIQSTNLTLPHEKLVSKYFDNVILALDNDEPGKEASKDIYNRLKNKVKISIFNYDAAGKHDIDDMNSDEIGKGIGEAKLL